MNKKTDCQLLELCVLHPGGICATKVECTDRVRDIVAKGLRDSCQQPLVPEWNDRLRAG